MSECYPQPLIMAKNIGLKYSSFGLFNRFYHHAIKDLSFEVYAGETFGIMGRNGCGKSSVLRLLAGIIKPTSGNVLMAQPLTSALLTLGLGFNPQLSGRNNAMLSCMLQGASKDYARSLLDDIKNFSELGAFFERPVKTYSAGMRSRLGFSTALTLKVDLLLIDETLSVGDASFNQKAEAALLDRVQGSQTVIFVSHNAAQVSRICSRAMWLEGGCLKESGDVSVVADAYKNFMARLNTVGPV
ncbi:ABC transporter ATP-binding protein [Simiduia agarivorans]|uniref:Wzt n=1 Tax=Simiduia agarivorans (strain DSM 21679 / JCM 13881 / BCRC 17597 / SA1) TaxID=1117647 RepID=K4KUZ8_SIMAS|nr:ATP-binding cassette domain-containing protein [Simiduia agarivorans]AFU97742.1 Wzt [Simiduia agarivorans SA1 = DSM 21679]